MKLAYRIISRMSITLLFVLTIWAVFFYFIMIEEINDETDDALEEYSEYIITRALAGENLPSKDNGTNNSYHITAVPIKNVKSNCEKYYFSTMIHIESKHEPEPARILKTTFRNANNQYYELTVSTPTIEKKDLKRTILGWIVFLYIILLFVIIIINVWILSRSFKPMYKLLNWIDHFSVEKKLAPLNNKTNITEFQKLTDAIIRSAQRSIEVYEQQKLFTGQASHELQTPLAICKNRLEMLADDPLLTETQLEEILKTRQTLEHIIKMNKALLLLTKIENRQFAEQKLITANDLIRKHINDYAEVYAHCNIKITLKETYEEKILMNETLASILFGNLVKNAYVHNHNNGEIDILIKQNQIAVKNTGTPEELDLNKIFKHFYQAKPKEGTIGLGLTLVKSICELYNIKIQYKLENTQHIFALEASSNA